MNALPYGLGAVLSHKFEDGSERSIDCIHFSHTSRNRDQVLPNWEGGACDCEWGQEISPVSFGKTVESTIRPQTFRTPVQWGTTNPCVKDTTVGLNIECVQLSYFVQAMQVESERMRMHWADCPWRKPLKMCLYWEIQYKCWRHLTLGIPLWQLLQLRQGCSSL